MNVPDEEICGSSFLSLNEDDLREMNIKIGPRKMLLKILQSQKPGRMPEKESENLPAIENLPELVSKKNVTQCFF